MRFIITSPFGAQESFRKHPHTGIDFAMEEGTPLKALKDGVIRIADYGDQNAGKTIFLETDEGTFIYGHLSEFLVRSGEKVRAGETIGLSGNTGHSTGPHLHLALKEDGEFVDPTSYGEHVQSFNEPGIIERFIQNGQIDQYGGVTFPDMIQEFASVFLLEHLIIIGGIALLLLNKWTRPYTLASIGLLCLSALI